MTRDLRVPEQAEPPDDATAALLRGVLHRQADAVEPGDGWSRIQAELARQPARRRPSGLRGFGPVLAAAAALVVVAGAGTVAVRSALREPVPPAGSLALRTSAAEDVLQTPSAALPVYVAARQHGRIVLYREFRRVTTRPDATAKVEAAVGLALTATPQDGDHEQLFAPAQGTKVGVRVSDEVVTLDISPAPRPARGGVTRAEATAAVQQLVWTATAAAAVATTPGGAAPAGPSRTVRILLDGRPGQALFGLVPLDRAFDRGYGDDPRAKAWVTEPAEGDRVAAGPLTASGDAAAGADATVHVTLTRGGRRVAEQDVPLEPLAGATGPVGPGQRGVWRISGWSATVPGSYRLAVTVVDADGTRWSDTTTFTVR